MLYPQRIASDSYNSFTGSADQGMFLMRARTVSLALMGLFILGSGTPALFGQDNPQKIQSQATGTLDKQDKRQDKQSVRLPRATPESQGVSSASIAKFIQAADEKVNSMHSFMLLRHGKVIAEAWWTPEDANKPHVLWSLSKSFTSTAVGLAVHDGKLSVQDRVIGFFPDALPENPSENLKSMRVLDLLTMSTGHQDEPNLRASQDWIKTFFAHPVPREPGSFFRYNTPATFMQSVIVQKVTGQNVVDYLQTRLFDPLGIDAPKWDKNPQGISIGGYGLYLKTEDIAKFGQLYLQKGRWENQQLIPSDWVQEASNKQVSNGSDATSDWNQGYGYQFWRCRHNAFRGDGKDGQFCIVLPDQDAVVVMTANTSNMQSQLSLVWEHLLDAMVDKDLPEAPKDRENLEAICTGLRAKR
jgi:CubicO group peptidase (beta-lactamase class C family)